MPNRPKTDDHTSSNQPEFAVDRKTLMDFVRPPISKSTFHDLVGRGIITPIKGDTLTPASWSSTEIQETALDEGDTERVTATLPAGPGPARFARLHVAFP